MTRSRAVAVVTAVVVVLSATVTLVPGAVPASMDRTGSTADQQPSVERDGEAAPARTPRERSSQSGATTPTETPERESTPSDGGRLGGEREGESDTFESEPARSFDSGNASVSVNFPTRPPTRALSGSLRTNRLYRSNEPGVGYDAELQWEKSGPTGFGLYNSVDTADVGPNARVNARKANPIKDGGAIMARAGGNGPLLVKDTDSATGWTDVGRNLPSPYQVTDAAIDPTDRDHIFAFVPSNESKRELLLYETTDGGESWSEVTYFSQFPNELTDRKTGYKGYRASGGGVELSVFENGQVFLYNYNADGGGSWGYYYDGSSWQQSTLSVPVRGGPTARNMMTFTDNGNGLLNPSGKLLYRTTDYGRSWTQIDNLTSTNAAGFSFGSSGNGQTINVLWKQQFNLPTRFRQTLTNEQISQGLARTFQRNGAQLAAGGRVVNESEGGDLEWKLYNGDSRWNVKDEGNRIKVTTCCYLNTSTDGGQTFSTRELSAPFPARGPQGLAVDPDNPSRLTGFIYMKGPYQSRDGGQSWTRIYRNGNVEKDVWANTFYEVHEIRGSGTTKQMPKPVDYRDIEVMDEYPDDPILVGSDQGLFVMSHPTDSISPVSLLNVGDQLDHTVTYDLEVDNCGNIYQGMWHHSALIREATSAGTKDYVDLYTVSAASPEAGAMMLKDPSNCQGWASVEAMKGGPFDFKKYVANRSGEWQQYDPPVGGANDEIEYRDEPVFFDGRWHFVNRSNWNLYAATLGGYPSKTREETNARNPKHDRAKDSLWYATDFVSPDGEPEDADGPNAQRLERIDSTDGVSVTSLDLSGSDITIDTVESRYDVHDGRVAVVVQKAPDKAGPNFVEDVLIYDDDTRGTVRADDIRPLDNPFGSPGSANIKDVWVDPTDDDRYFAAVVNRSTSGRQCPYQLMVTGDSGETWEQFSHELRCSRVFDMDFNQGTGTVYVAAHQRGILEGDIGNLQQTSDLAVNTTCADDEIAGGGMLNCTVDFDVDGPVKTLWKDDVTINISTDLDPHTYTLLTDEQTLRNAGCRPNAIGVFEPEYIICRSATQDFPRNRNLSIDIRLARKNSTTPNPAQVNVTAALNITAGPQDLRYRNDRDTTTVDVYDEPTTDRYDYHSTSRPAVTTEDDASKNNDNISTPAYLEQWTHRRSDHHLACPENPGYPGGDRTVEQLESQGEDCSSILTDPSTDAPLTAEEIWVMDVDDLSLWTGTEVDHYEVPVPRLDQPSGTHSLNLPECGTKQLVVRPSGGASTPATKTVRSGAPTARPYVRTLEFSMPGSYEQDIRGITPQYQGSTSRQVPQKIEQAFANNGIQLTNRAKISTPGGVSWQNASKWYLNTNTSPNERYLIEPSGGQLKVYRLTRPTGTPATTPSGTQQTKKLFETSTWLEVTAVPERNSVADAGLDPTLLDLFGYSRRDVASRLGGSAVTYDRSERNLTMRVDCPRSGQGLSRLVSSVGEDNLTVGGYRLEMEYHVHISRPNDIRAKQRQVERAEDIEEAAGVGQCLRRITEFQSLSGSGSLGPGGEMDRVGGGVQGPAGPSGPGGVPTCELGNDAPRTGPGWAFGNERVNIYVEGGGDEPGDPRVYHARIEDGRLTTLGPAKVEDPTMRATMDEETFREIESSDAPRAAIQRNYEQGDVRVRGVGPINGLKVGLVNVGADVVDFATDIGEAVSPL